MRGKYRWPADVRCVAMISVDFDGPSHEIGRNLRPLGINSWGRYAGRCGVPRYLDLFEKYQIPSTFFIPGYDAEYYPQVTKDIHRRGFEVAAHGYLHEAWALGDEEEELLARTHNILCDLTGAAPVGWRSPSGRKTARTMRVLKRLGYRYDSSDKDYDLPYLVRLDDRRRPHRLYLGEGFFRADFKSQERFVDTFSNYLAGHPEKFMLIDLFDDGTNEPVGEYGFGGFKLYPKRAVASKN